MSAFLGPNNHSISAENSSNATISFRIKIRRDIWVVRLIVQPTIKLPVLESKTNIGCHLFFDSSSWAAGCVTKACEKLHLSDHVFFVLEQTFIPNQKAHYESSELPSFASTRKSLKYYNIHQKGSK